MADRADLRLVVAADHAGFALKEQLKRVLQQQGVQVHDLGTHDEASTDYPDYAHRLAGKVGAGEFPVGLLLCGTGLGMSMAANRHAGVRAAVCADCYSARMARLHNNANVLCLGSRVVGPGLAEEILATFLDATFEGGRHVRRVDKIDASR